MFCSQCGQQLNEESQFCFTCGTKVIENQTVESAPESREVEKETPSEESQIWNTPTPVINTTSSAPNQGGMIKALVGVTIALLVAVVVLVFFIVRQDDDTGSGTLGGTNMTGQQGAQYSDGQQGNYVPVEDYFVWRVQSGNLDNHPDILIGMAFERFLESPVWNHFTDGTIDYVSIHGNVFYDNNPVVYQVVFQFAADGNSFFPINLVIGGSWQDVLLMNDFLDDVMNAARG